MSRAVSAGWGGVSWLLSIALPVAYGVVALLALRPLAGHFAWSWTLREARRKRRDYPSLYGRKETEGAEPSTDAWCGAYCCALALVALWPVVLCVYGAGRFGPRIGAEREAELKARERHIAELERELGIGAEA